MALINHAVLDNLFNLTLTHGILFLLAAAIVAWVARDIYLWYRLRHVPGPFLNSITVLVLMRQIFNRRSAWYFTELSDQYGKLVRIAPGQVVVTDANAFRAINGIRSRYKRGPFFTAFRFIPGKDNIFSLQVDAQHKSHRARLAPGYQGRSNDGYDEAIDRNLARLFRLIDDQLLCTRDHPNRLLDLHLISHFLPLDIIGEVALGQAFGYLDRGEDLYQFVHINGQFFIYAVTLACTPWVLALLQTWPFSRLLPREADVAGFGKIVGVATNIIDQRLRLGAKPGRDMLQGLMDAGLSRDELIQESIVQIVAGTDTIGSTMRTTLCCLLTHPSAYGKVVDELTTAACEGRLSTPATDAECRTALPYLQAALREAMRLYPPLTALAFKEVVPPAGDVVAGHPLPPGTQVGQNIYGILRDRAYWGEDADAFVPDRWLDVEQGRAREMAAVLDLTFGHGKYKCLGRQLALAEINKFFVEFLRRYDVAAATPHSPFHIAAAFGWPSDSFMLRVTKRD